jgi:hypothetical protein
VCVDGALVGDVFVDEVGGGTLIGRVEIRCTVRRIGFRGQDDAQAARGDEERGRESGSGIHRGRGEARSLLRSAFLRYRQAVLTARGRTEEGNVAGRDSVGGAVFETMLRLKTNRTDC